MADMVEKLLRELGRRGISIAADGENLRYKPRDRVTPELLERILAVKEKLLCHLEPPLKFGDIARGWTPPDWADYLDGLAGRCERYHPDKADRYRRWAADVREKNPPDPAGSVLNIQTFRPADRTDAETAAIVDAAPQSVWDAIDEIESVFGEVTILDIQPPPGFDVNQSDQSTPAVDANGASTPVNQPQGEQGDEP